MVGKLDREFLVDRKQRSVSNQADMTNNSQRRHQEISYIHERSMEDHPLTHATTSQEDSQYVTQEPPTMTRPKFN